MFVCPVPKISQVMMKRRRRATISKGSFENEALENEAPKSRKRSTLDRKRSTQNSKTKTPKLANEAP